MTLTAAENLAALSRQNDELDDLAELLSSLTNAFTTTTTYAAPITGEEMQEITKEELDKETIGLFFIDARPPYQRKDGVALKKGLLPIEEWLKQQYNWEMFGTKPRSGSSAIFICQDGVTSKCAASNQLRYHGDSLRAFYASLSEKDVRSFLKSSGVFKAYQRAFASA